MSLMTLRERKRLLRDAGPFYAESHREGILIKLAWSGGRAWTIGGQGPPTEFDRMRVAEAVEEALNHLLRVGRPRGRRRGDHT